MKTIFIILISMFCLSLIGCSDAEGQYFSTSQDRTWTVPSDNSGFIAQYDFRYTADTTLAWDSWTQVMDEPAPLSPGSIQTYTMSMPDGEWYIAMKSADASGNWSEISNIVWVLLDTQAPTRVTDLQ